MSPWSHRTLYAAAALLLATFGACGFDPVHDRAVADLGAESPDVPRGPYHRPGQPCLTCHGGKGPGARTFLVAGTVFRDAAGTRPLSGAEVRVRDATQTAGYVCVKTNCGGNFYLTEHDYPQGITFPLKASVAAKSEKTMESMIGRDGSCATCHNTRLGGDAVTPIFIDTQEDGAPCSLEAPAREERCE